MSTRTVYVVAYGPLKGVAGTHGFDHYLHRDAAVHRVQELIEEDVEGYIFTFFPAKIVGLMDEESVAEDIREKYSEWLP